MTKLVEDIIDLSQLDGGSGDRTWEETDLYRIAVNTVESLQTAADETGVEITVTGVPARIYGLQDILHSIVYNLCDNAIKYSKPGGHVHVQVDDAPDKAILIVEDDGIGIPKADQERIFERFYRVDKSHSKEVGGTGLGLSIVKHAVLIHNAEIKVDSEPGKGSRFTITFPKTQPENR
jgi:two-component system phosphate regulon sensor histidine kinase PhoR